jgi:hypothetical protein
LSQSSPVAATLPTSILNTTTTTTVTIILARLRPFVHSPSCLVSITFLISLRLFFLLLLLLLLLPLLLSPLPPPLLPQAPILPQQRRLLCQTIPNQAAQRYLREVPRSWSEAVTVGPRTCQNICQRPRQRPYLLVISVMVMGARCCVCGCCF